MNTVMYITDGAHLWAVLLQDGFPSAIEWLWEDREWVRIEGFIGPVFAQWAEDGAFTEVSQPDVPVTEGMINQALSTYDADWKAWHEAEKKRKLS